MDPYAYGVVSPYGWNIHTEVTPKPAPIRLHWRIGPVTAKNWSEPVGGSAPARTYHPAPPSSEGITVQLTADQQVTLTVSGEDAYDNPVDLAGANAQWSSSDEAIVTVTVDDEDSSQAVAAAVGPVGTAAVTVASSDGTLQGSLAIDVVAGDVTEIVITAGEPEDKA